MPDGVVERSRVLLDSEVRPGLARTSSGDKSGTSSKEFAVRFVPPMKGFLPWKWLPGVASVMAWDQGLMGRVAGLSKAMQTAGYDIQPQQLQSITNGQLQGLLRDGRQRIRDDLDSCPRTAPSQGARKCTYARMGS